MDRDHGVAEVVLSEERAQVATRTVPVERVRVRRRVVTQTRTVTVEERREELVIERIPVSEGEEAPEGERAGDELVVVLRAEVAEVVTRVVPVEAVRIRRETVTGTAVVDRSLRRERAEVVTEPGQP